MSEQSVLFLQDMAWTYRTATAVNEDNLMTDLGDVSDKVLQLKDGQVALYFLRNAVKTR